MRYKFAAAFLVFLPLVAAAGKFVTITSSPDTGGMKSRLTITTLDGARFDAPKDAEQVGYENAYISPNGKYVGWLDMYPLPGANFNYPVPGPLVVLDQSKKLHYFRAGPESIFEWCFVPGVAEVAYESGPLHFSNAAAFYLRRISDGRLLATFSFPNQSIAERVAAAKRAPRWVQCVLKQAAANYASMRKH